MKRHRVLIVEDAKSVREVVAFMLRNRGYEVLEAADGLEADKKARSDGPDLIVLDAMLPHKTGFEICSDLKRDLRYKHIPIIMLTAITRDSGKSDDYWKQRSGADDFMSKPFRAAELIARIEKLLEGRDGKAEETIPDPAAP